MFLFDRKQDIYEIGGVKVGGQPGECATVMCGTIFYAKHYLVEDAEKGIFDKKAAEDVLNKQDEFSDLTGNPCMMQIFSESPEAMEKEIAFCVEKSDSPFLIDSTVAEAKVAGLKYVDEVGLTDRAVYNSINVSCSPEELKAIEESKIEAAILLAFNPKDSTVAGKIDLLETGAGTFDKGLVQLARDMGVTKQMCDPATLPIGAGVGSAISSGFVIKSKYGISVGLGIHNAPSAWTWLKTFRKEHATKGPGGWEGLGADVFKICDIASNVIPIIAGQDFVLYGPIEHAPLTFPLVGMADMIVAEANAAEHGIESLEPHPILKMTA
uniref:Tetrahydromethanopterin S-methyltransferase subunit H n=1 Tax=Candidatus Methanophagaceae archaeon ANME-1 ERB6 TaxID=2759912 RepID=A0A7G9YUT2_9EURY|nr:tetrahydromethanopterin S-methyltransferase subunit H [Methanosarcinales archaeon ANME-1 ERB6]QNO52053.1 tetrahydromethanopterin S-methyltransferase subunit H [Methanosarcinales archaeon ANME-1 ERB6]